MLKSKTIRQKKIWGEASRSKLGVPLEIVLVSAKRLKDTL